MIEYIEYRKDCLRMVGSIEFCFDLLLVDVALPERGVSSRRGNRSEGSVNWMGKMMSIFDQYSILWMRFIIWRPMCSCENFHFVMVRVAMYLCHFRLYEFVFEWWIMLKQRFCFQCFNNFQFLTNCLGWWWLILFSPLIPPTNEFFRIDF